ncbi:hypothetical protein [Salinibacter ruber]|uniref:hypothetical protein n=1 Tax=Salinibacter ruber TaxID=146919 RepID=UPI000E58C610|nr:hypothetical protein [Salinibacter ruber]
MESEKVPPGADEHLEELCRNRSLETEEIFGWNAFYGIDQIIKTYASLFEQYSLKGVWPHGLVFDPRKVLEAERKTALPTVFCYPPYRVSAYREHTDKRVIPSAHPFLYLLDMVDAEEGEREGTLFFPQHSTHHVTAEMNYAALAENLAALERKYQPVTVCLYWKDYNLGRAVPFREKGLSVTSAGHMFDPAFLYRFYNLCTRHEYAAGNGIGSHIFYSVAAGCSYFHVEGVDYELTGDEEVLERDTAEPDDDIVHRVRDTFGPRPPSSIEKQKQEAGYFLGADYKKSQTGLLKDLMWAELFDKFRVPPGEKNTRAQYFPTFWQRGLIPKLRSMKSKVIG